MYKLANTSIMRLGDGASIPLDIENRDFQDYEDWLAEGNTPLPADLPPPPTPLEKIRALEQAHDDDQRKLNRQAAIDTALTIMCRSPMEEGKTRAEVHAMLYESNRGYRATVDLEAKVDLLRKLIV